MKNKPNPKDFILSGKEGETLLRKPGEIRGYDFVIENLRNCTVFLLDHSAAITVDECTGCRFVIGPVEGSIFFRDCAECQVAVCCQQLRTKNCHRILFNAMVASDPTIEYSDELQFGPYNFAYPKLDEHLSKAHLKVEDDRWSQIFDFNKEDNVSHWKLQDPQEFKEGRYQLEGFEDPVNPVPRHRRYGGSLSGPIPLGSQQQMGAEDASGMIAMSIDTSQTQAQGLLLAGEDPFAGFEKQPQAKDFDPFATGAKLGPNSEEADQFFSIPNPSEQHFVPLGPPQGEEEDEVDDDLDEDARSRIRASELSYQSLMKGLYEKDEAERCEKDLRRSQAAEELEKWKEERARQIDQRKDYNRQQEEGFIQARRTFNEGAAWKKVSSMIDFKESSDRKDMARMRQVLLARKNE